MIMRFLRYYKLVTIKFELSLRSHGIVMGGKMLPNSLHRFGKSVNTVV